METPPLAIYEYKGYSIQKPFHGAKRPLRKWKILRKGEAALDPIPEFKFLGGAKVWIDAVEKGKIPS